MSLTQRHLGPIFDNIVDLLSAQPEQLESFELWASRQTSRLRNAAKHGPAALSYEAELLRSDLMMMNPPADFDAMLSERTERMLLCQRQWLTGLLDFVDDLLDDAPDEPMLRAA